jgi:hypothetical protein
MFQLQSIDMVLYFGLYVEPMYHIFIKKKKHVMMHILRYTLVDCGIFCSAS